MRSQFMTGRDAVGLSSNKGRKNIEFLILPTSKLQLRCFLLGKSEVMLVCLSQVNTLSKDFAMIQKK